MINVIRYLICTVKHEILLPNDLEGNLACLCDADWARNYENGRSRSVRVLNFGGGPIIWS